MNTIVTGAAGFIGMHVSQRLLARGDNVIGVDNLNDYYDVGLKLSRLDQLQRQKRFRFCKADISDFTSISNIFDANKVTRVVHLAAQAGVRYSITNPHAYAEANLVGFLNILEACRAQKCEHLVYASSSSVYGGNARMPFRESDGVDHPVSLYAATKRANELMAHSYSHLYSIPTTGLRFFTVYGPWGRPDMAYFKFARSILAGETISVYNNGNLERDFTYIDDIVDGVIRVLDSAALPDSTFNAHQPDAAVSAAPYRILNIGNEQPVRLLTFIETLEAALGKIAVKKMMPMQPGDVLATHSDTSRITSLIGAQRRGTSLKSGLESFSKWYLEYYNSERAGV